MARLPGTFRIGNQLAHRRGAGRGFEFDADPWELIGDSRVLRILQSIQTDLDEGGICRVRQILKGPHELYRLELERPDMSYERTTILDRDTLTQLLEQLPEDTVRECFRFSS